MKKISVAVIGVGTMGRHHARNFFEDEEADLVAVSDIDEKRGREIASRYNCDYFANYRQLLESRQVAAVSIAVPTTLHFKVGMDCLLSGKHVFVEKPICKKSSQAKKLIEEAYKKKLILAVGHVERFNPAVVELKKYLAQEEIGKVVSLSAKRVGLYPPSIKDNNVIVDLAIHDIDIFSYLLDKQPQKIFCLGGKALTGKREDYVEILLSYKGSIHGAIQVNWITPVKIRQLAVTGTKGYIELDYINQKLKIYRSRLSRTFETFGDFLVKFGRPDVIDISIAAEEPLKVELRDFIDCVRERKKPKVDGNVGLAALLVAERAQKVLVS